MIVAEITNIDKGQFSMESDDIKWAMLHSQSRYNDKSEMQQLVCPTKVPCVFIVFSDPTSFIEYKYNIDVVNQPWKFDIHGNITKHHGFCRNYWGRPSRTCCRQNTPQVIFQRMHLQSHSIWAGDRRRGSLGCGIKSKWNHQSGNAYQSFAIHRLFLWSCLEFCGNAASCKHIS